MSATEERDWESLERALRAEEASRRRKEGGSIEISDLDLNVCHCLPILFEVVIDTWICRCTRKALWMMMS
jgi:hypothetical protein